MLDQNKSPCHAAQADTTSPEAPIKPDYSENIDTENLTMMGAPTFKETPEELLERYPRNENFTHYQVKHVSPVFSVEIVQFASCSDVADAYMRSINKEFGCDLFQVDLTRSGIQAGKGYFCYPKLHWTCQVSERGLVNWLPLHSCVYKAEVN